MVKASGLAAGKGVVVAANTEEACAAIDEMLTDQKFGTAGATVVVEEILEGEEVSVSRARSNYQINFGNLELIFKIIPLFSEIVGSGIL